jgi:hypothetical protein
MKKSIIALFAAATMVAGVNAQEEGAGGSSAAGVGIGGVAGTTIATVAVVGGVAAGIIANANADTPGEEEPTLTCEGSDPLVGDVCVGTTNTLTTTVSGTVTQTITVPVTFTYAPSI